MTMTYPGDRSADKPGEEPVSDYPPSYPQDQSYPPAQPYPPSYPSYPAPPSYPETPSYSATPYPPPAGYPQQPGYPPSNYPPQPGYPPQGGWPGPPPSSTGTNGMAIAALVTGVIAVFLGFFCVGFVPGIAAVILGIVALNQIKTTQQSGKGMAIAGIATGGVGVAIVVIFFTIGIMANLAS